jgi:hypothetical protein
LKLSFSKLPHNNNNNIKIWSKIFLNDMKTYICA